MSGRLGYATARATPPTVTPMATRAKARPKVQARKRSRKRCQAGRGDEPGLSDSESEVMELQRGGPGPHYKNAFISGHARVGHRCAAPCSGRPASAVWHWSASVFDNGRRGANRTFPLWDKDVTASIQVES